VVARNEQGHILLLKRPASHPKHPNQWTLPGGKVDYLGEGRCIDVQGHFGSFPGGYGESDTAGAAAEFEEETGIPSKMLGKIPVTIISSEHEIICFEELVPIESNELPKPFPNAEHTEYMWLEDSDDIPNGLSEKVIWLLQFMDNMGAGLDGFFR
jgi:8-oxo-dGTP pyrophosphatase MutT (NUDIX family)